MEGGYHNFEVKWIGGKHPTLYIYDENHVQLSETQLYDMNKEALVSLIREKGFDLKVFVPEMPSFTKDPDSEKTIGGQHYQLFNDKVTYEQAKTYAEGRTYQGQTGRLPTISCEAQQAQLDDWIQSTYSPTSEGVWLGASDEAYEGVWKWTSNGETFYQNGHHSDAYNHWRPGEPNNANNNEHCASMVSDGWNDVKCDGKELQRIIVEFGPPSSTLCAPSDQQEHPAAEHESL